MIDKSKLKEAAIAAKERPAEFSLRFVATATANVILELLAELETTQLAGAARQGGNTCDLTDYGTPVTYSNGTGASPDPSAKQEPSDLVESEKEDLRRLAVQSMADCMDMVRQDLIDMGIIDKSVAPMFIPEAIANYIKRTAAQSASASPAARGVAEEKDSAQE